MSRKIVHLPTARLTPTVLLAGLLEDAAEIEAVMAVYTRGSIIHAVWSEMNTLQQIGLATLMQQEALANAAVAEPAADDAAS